MTMQMMMTNQNSKSMRLASREAGFGSHGSGKRHRRGDTACDDADPE